MIIRGRVRRVEEGGESPSTYSSRSRSIPPSAPASSALKTSAPKTLAAALSSFFIFFLKEVDLERGPKREASSSSSWLSASLVALRLRDLVGLAPLVALVGVPVGVGAPSVEGLRERLMPWYFWLGGGVSGLIGWKGCGGEGAR